jgi:hypothetical protein
MPSATDAVDAIKKVKDELEGTLTAITGAGEEAEETRLALVALRIDDRALLMGQCKDSLDKVSQTVTSALATVDEAMGSAYAAMGEA